MTDSLLTLLPATDVTLGGWTVTGGVPAHTVLADSDDTTYAQASGSAGAALRVGLGAAGLLATDLLRYVRPWVRATSPAGARVLGVRLYGLGAQQVLPEQQLTLADAAARYDLLPYQGWPNGRPFTLADLSGLLLAFREVTSPPGSLRLLQAGVDLVFNGAPTAVLTGPITPVTDNGLVTLEWTYSDPEADPQARSQGLVYARPSGGWPTNAADTDAEVTALQIAGEQPLLDFTQLGDLLFGPEVLLAPEGNHRAFLRVGDLGTSGRYGQWATTEFDMAVTGAPLPPTVVVTPDDANAQVRLDVTPSATSIDRYQVQRSDDNGDNWYSVLGMRPTVPYVPDSPNLLNDAGFAADSNNDGLADDWLLYSTPGGDALPVADVVPGPADTHAQRVTWTTNTGHKGVGTQPRVAPGGGNVWPGGSLWLVSFLWAASGAAITPELRFDAGGYTVTWVLNPTPTADFQLYVAEVLAPGGDTTSNLYLAHAGNPNNHFDVAQVQLTPAVQLATIGLGTRPLGAEQLGGPSTSTGADPAGTLIAPPWRAREDTGLALFDRTAPREYPVLYRVRSVADDGAGTAWGTVQRASDWCVTDPATLSSDGNAWLQSSTDGGLDAAFCQGGLVWAGTATEDQVAYTAEGRPDAIVVGGTVHSEAFSGVLLVLQNDDEWAAFRRLRDLGQPLLFRTLYGEGPLEQVWLRIGPDVATERQGGYTEMRVAQVRRVTFAAYQVAEPA